MNPSQWSAAVVGLGQVGSRFDAEPGRKTVWSHVGAYLALPETFRLAAACEIDCGNVEAFSQRCTDVPVFGDVAEMLAVAKPAVVSVCTPAQTHSAIVRQIAKDPNVRAIWCEKPLDADIDAARAMVAACADQGKRLVVSYVRRWNPVWVAARKHIEAGAVGRVRSVRIALPNRVLSMGSHAIDLIAFLGGPLDAVVPFVLPELAEEGEPAVSAFVRLRAGGFGLYQVTGLKHNYLVEGEIVGDTGRMTVREDLAWISLEHFAPSVRYKGYRELEPPKVEKIEIAADFSPFVAIAREIDALLRGVRVRATCDGQQAFETQTVVDALAQAAADAQCRTIG